MWLSLWPFSSEDDHDDRFSLHHFKNLINQLQNIKAVNEGNKELIIDILQSIVEVVSYGDKHNPLVFECFMECQVLAEFVRLLKISAGSIIEAHLLQYLSIMIQNMDSEHAIYYCLSNDYINSIITHQFEFDKADLTSYYVSFLRAVGSKINKDTICLLVKFKGNAVVSFPLYVEAMKFAHHGEKMIQTAVRALSLMIYHVSDDLVIQYITSPPISKYLSDFVHFVKNQCFHLNVVIQAKEDSNTYEKRRDLLSGAEKFTDELYYLKDILSVHKSRLTALITQNLLSILIIPLLLPLVQFRSSDGSDLSIITRVYAICNLLQVIGGKSLINFVGKVLLYPYVCSREDTLHGSSQDSSFFNCVNEMERMVHGVDSHESPNITGIYLSGLLAQDTLPAERTGILGCILSDNHLLLVASLYLLLTIAESKDLDSILAPAIKLGLLETGTNNSSNVEAGESNFFIRYMPQILNALLQVLASQSLSHTFINRQTGRLLRKLLYLQGKKISDQNSNLFNTSYEQSCNRLREELEGCWFDCIPDTLKTEWERCKEVTQESSQTNDPIFMLELAFDEENIDGRMTSYIAWQRMVNVVKVFILHSQLKAFILDENRIEKPFSDLMSRSAPDARRTGFPDLSSAGFGSDIALVSGFSCRIALPSSGIRDVYIIPLAGEVSGKLLLVEKHPFRSQRGIVISIAPLAGLDPKIDDNHLNWLHLRIREFNPRFHASPGVTNQLKMTDHLIIDGRWTLGFANNEACRVARTITLKEIAKQRSYVLSIVVRLISSES